MTQRAPNLFNRLKILGLRPCRTMLFARSTYPFMRGVCYGGPINADVIFIVELEELLPGELCAVVRDNGV